MDSLVAAEGAEDSVVGELFSGGKKFSKKGQYEN